MEYLLVAAAANSDKNNFNESNLNNRQTRYRIPKKQLGFGSSRKRLKNESGEKEGFAQAANENSSGEQIPLFFYEQAYIIKTSFAVDIAKIISRTIRVKYLKDEAEWVSYDLLVKACYSYEADKVRLKEDEDIGEAQIKYILFKFKKLLLNWLKKELQIKNRLAGEKTTNIKSEVEQKINDELNDTLNESESNSPLILSSELIYTIEGQTTEQRDGDTINKELANILLEFIKQKTYPYEFEIYKLSYCLGLSDPEIAEYKNMERSCVTRTRNNVVKLILHYKDEIEQLFQEFLE